MVVSFQDAHDFCIVAATVIPVLVLTRFIGERSPMEISLMEMDQRLCESEERVKDFRIRVQSLNERLFRIRELRGRKALPTGVFQEVRACASEHFARPDELQLRDFRTPRTPRKIFAPNELGWQKQTNLHLDRLERRPNTGVPAFRVPWHSPALRP